MKDISTLHLAEESDIPEEYNEIDVNGDPESSWIRNIVNFKLIDDAGQPLSFADLGEGKPLGTLVGEVVVPLPAPLKQRILDTSCTVAQQLIPENFVPVLGHDQVPPAPMDAAAIEAAAAKPPALAPWFDTELFYEQTYRANGNRMPALATMAITVRGIEDWAVEYSYALPSMYLVAQSGVWYRVAGPLYSGHIPLLIEKYPEGSTVPWGTRGQAVRAAASPPVEEDEGSYHTPVLVDPYIDPATYGCCPSYKPSFIDPMETFFVCAHVVFSVLDVIVNNPRACNFEIVSAEVLARSAGVVSKEIVLKHYKFLIEQILALERPVGASGKPLSLSSCAFVNQLKKEGEKNEKLIIKNMEKKKKNLKSAPAAGPAPGNKRKALAGISGLFPNQTKATPPEEVKITVTPMPDREYWQALAEANLGPGPYPYPSHCAHSDEIPFGLPGKQHVGPLLQVWSILTNFQKHFKLPDFSPELLGAALTMKNALAPPSPAPLDESSVNIYNALDHLRDGFVLSDGHDFLAELHIKLLAPMILRRAAEQRAHFSNEPAYDISVCPPEKVVDVAQAFEDLGFTLYSSPADYYTGPGASPEDGLLLLNADAYGSGDLTEESVASLLRTGGDTWVEALRLLVADKQSVDSGTPVCLPEYAVPMLECENILKWILSIPEAKHLVVDVETKKTIADGDEEEEESEEDNEYSEMRENLQEVLGKLQKGLYFRYLHRDNNGKDADTELNDNATKISADTVAGDSIDYFDTSVGMWCPAVVISVGTAGGKKGTPTKSNVDAPKTLTLRCKEWEYISSGVFDITLPLDSDLVAPFKLYSEKVATKFVPPILGAENESASAMEETDVKENRIIQVESGLESADFMGGMEKFYADVNRIFAENYESFSGDNEQLALSTKAVQALFNEVFEKRVGAPARLHAETVTNITRNHSFRQEAVSAAAPSGEAMCSSGVASGALTSPPRSMSGVSVVGQLSLEKWLDGRDNKNLHRVGATDMPPLYSSWSEVIRCLQCTEYVSLPFEVRLQCLHFLCLELVSQHEIYDIVMNSSESHSTTAVGTYKNMYNSKVRDRGSGAGTALSNAQKKGDPTPAPKPEPVSEKKAPVETNGGSLSRRSSRNSGGVEDFKVAVATPEPVKAVVSEQLVDDDSAGGPIYNRIYPIGEDRDGRIYWIFEDSKPVVPVQPVEGEKADPIEPKVHSFSRLFCEELSVVDESFGPKKVVLGNNTMVCPNRMSPSRWCCFESVSDINKLLAWLSDWGFKEVALKKRLIEWRDSKQFREAAEHISEALIDIETQKSALQARISEDMDISDSEWDVASPDVNGVAKPVEEPCMETEAGSQMKTEQISEGKNNIQNGGNSNTEHVDLVDTTTSTSTEPAEAPGHEVKSSDPAEEVVPFASPSGRSRRSSRAAADKKYNEDFLTAEEMNKALSIGAINKVLNSNDKKRKRKSTSASAVSPGCTPDKKKKRGSNDGADPVETVDEFTTEAHVSARHAAIEGRLKEMTRLRNFYMRGARTTNQMLAVCLKLNLGSKGQLGVGVKDTHGCIIVTGYYNDVDGVSPGKEAGLRLGDRILYCNNRYVNDISCLQAALKERTETGEGAFAVLILRQHAPLASKDVQRCIHDDKFLRSLYKKQSTNDLVTLPYIDVSADINETVEPTNGSAVVAVSSDTNDGMEVTQEVAAGEGSKSIPTCDSHTSAVYNVLSDYYARGPLEQSNSAEYRGTYSNPILPRHHVYPAQCLGVLLQMVLDTAHPFVTSNQWRLREAPFWSSAINSQVAHIEVLIAKCCENGSELCYQEIGSEVAKLKSMIKSCLVALIPALDDLRMAFNSHLYAVPHRQVRWMAMLMSACERSTSWQAISACVSILYNSVSWADIEAATLGVERDKFMRQFDVKRKLGYIPRAGDTVVYFSSGHDAALVDEANRHGVPSMWTSKNYPNFSSGESDDDVSKLPFRGQKEIVTVCTVNRVTCFPCGLGTATGGVGRVGKHKAKQVLIGDRKNSFPFAYVELTVRADESNAAELPAFSKVKYDASDVADVTSFESAVTKAVKKFQHHASGSRCVTCDPEAAKKIGKRASEWLEEYESSKLPVAVQTLVPGTAVQNIAMGEGVESSCKTNAIIDDYLLRSHYVSGLLLALTKTLNILCANPVFGAFLLLVDQDLFPDYYSMIKKPIALRMIETNVLQLKYTHVSHFYADMMLLRDNCLEYCADRYPDMIVTAEALLYTSICLCERLLPNFLSRPTPDVNSLALSPNQKNAVTAEGESLRPQIGETFSIGVRLLGNCSEYIIPINKYTSCGVSQGRGRYPVGCCFSMPYQVAEPDDAGHGVQTENSIGMITGTKGPASTQIVPWEWLKVSWIAEAADAEDSGDLPQFVNPWEIDMLNFPIDLKKLNYSY